MSFAQTLAVHLADDAAVAALVSDRIYHLQMGDDRTKPYIVYQAVSGGSHTQHQGGISGLVFERWQFDVYAAPATGAEEVTDAVRLFLDGDKGTWGTGGNTDVVESSELIDMPDIWEEPEHGDKPGVVRKTMLFEFSYRESTS